MGAANRGAGAIVGGSLFRSVGPCHMGVFDRNPGPPGSLSGGPAQRERCRVDSTPRARLPFESHTPHRRLSRQRKRDARTGVGQSLPISI